MNAARAGSCSQTLLGGARLLATYRLPASPNPSSSPPRAPLQSRSKFCFVVEQRLGNPSVTGRLACLLIHRTGNFFLLQSLYFFVCSFLLQRVCRGPEEGNSDTKITEIDLFQMVLQVLVLNYRLPRFSPKQGSRKAARDSPACPLSAPHQQTEPGRNAGWCWQARGALLRRAGALGVQTGPKAGSLLRASRRQVPAVPARLCLCLLASRAQAAAASPGCSPPPAALKKSPPLRSPHLASARSAQLGEQGTKDQKKKQPQTTNPAQMLSAFERNGDGRNRGETGDGKRVLRAWLPARGGGVAQCVSSPAQTLLPPAPPHARLLPAHPGTSARTRGRAAPRGGTSCTLPPTPPAPARYSWQRDPYRALDLPRC